MSRKRASKKHLPVHIRYGPRGDLAQLTDRWQIPAVDPSEFELKPEILSLIPVEMARRHLAVPIDIIRGRLVVALPDPTDKDAIDDLERAGGMPISAVVATRPSIRAALRKLYPS